MVIATVFSFSFYGIACSNITMTENTIQPYTLLDCLVGTDTASVQVLTTQTDVNSQTDYLCHIDRASIQFNLDGFKALEKAHTRSTRSLRSFP